MPERPSTVVAERRFVTILFADIVGSTEIAATHEPEQVRHALARIFARTSELLTSYGGTVEKFIGDAVMAVFGVPQSHDDDAERAVRAAVALREVTRELNAALPFQVDLRIGVNSGEVATGIGDSGQFLVTGLAVNIAARFYSVAAPGEILVGQRTRDLTDSVVSYGSPRSLEAKGVGVIEAWPVTGTVKRGADGAWDQRDDLRAPLVGREREIAILRDAADRARRDGRPLLVTVVGEPGIGKSRLISEFIAGSTGIRPRIGRCLPYGEAIQYHAVRAILSAEAGVGSDVPPAVLSAALRERVFELCGGAAGDVAERIAVLAGVADADLVLPGVVGDELEAELRWAFRRFVEGAAATPGLALVLEDAHWASDQLLDVIEDTAELAAAPVLMCCLTRPELLDRRGAWGARAAHAITIRLRSLSPRESEEMIRGLLGRIELPVRLAADLAERSGGNPLYVEELVRALIAAGRVRRDEGRWTLAGMPTADVPDSLRGLITARLDQLAGASRRALQHASVLGRAFSVSALRALSTEGVEGGALQEAQRRGFLIRMSEPSRSDGGSYHFRHALIRDAVYGSIPKDERVVLHERAVAWLEGRQRERAEDLSDLVAHHLEQAFLLARDLRDPRADDLGLRAHSVLVAVADRARAHEAWPQALSAYDRAERLAAAARPDQIPRHRVLAWSAVAHHAVDHDADSHVALQRALEVVRSQGPTDGLAYLLGLLATHEPAPRNAELADAALDIARAVGRPEVIGWSLWHRTQCDPGSAEVHARNSDEALAHARTHQLRTLLPWLLTASANRASHDGRLSAGGELLREAYEIAKASGARMAVARAAAFVGLRSAQLHDSEAMIPYVDEAVSAARETGDRAFLAATLWHVAWAEFQTGLYERQRDHAAEALALSQAASDQSTEWRAHQMLLRAYTSLGDLDRAREHETRMRQIPVGAEDQLMMDLASAQLAAAEDRAEAEVLFRGVLDRITATDAAYLTLYSKWDWIRSLCQEWLGEHLAAQGRIEDARAMLVAARAFWRDPSALRRREEIDRKIERLTVGSRIG